MITGGGAKNTYLIERLKRYFKGQIILPDNQLIDFKEALIFALLGVLFLEKEPNCIASVTGASKRRMRRSFAPSINETERSFNQILYYFCGFIN